MTGFNKVNEIHLGESNGTTGHTSYRNAYFTANNKKIVVKENKFSNPSFSRLEVSFSRVAQLFLNPHLTPKQGIVYQENGTDIFGVFSEHLCYTIAQKEGAEQKNFYVLSKSEQEEDDDSDSSEINLAGYTLKKQMVADSRHINFFDNLPQGFFTQLINNPEISIDYDSLASILATSYTLEEDDLHKGNFGFYLVERNGRPHAVFFKIDHDLMFVDSIMAFHTRRQFHWLHGPNAFNIHVDDLRFFPNISAAHSYWPTKFGYISHPFHGKEYHDFSENRAFSNLSVKRHFIKAKWKAFYRHILIPTTLIEHQLMECADFNDPVERAHIALVTNAIVSRVVHLRAALMAMPEFRKFVCKLTDAENDALIDELTCELSVDDDETKKIKKEAIRDQVRTAINEYRRICNPKNESFEFEEGDTPLHTAIKIGAYRYDETYRNYGQFINTPNKQGKTPLDIALERIPEQVNGTEKTSKDMYAIIKHLLEKGAAPTEAYKKYKDIDFTAYKLSSPYVTLITPQTTYFELKEFLRNIGEQHDYSLKNKKLFAIECIQKWIQERKLQLSPEEFKTELKALKKDINGRTDITEAAPLLYIRQLRSQYWIIRQIRGLYGMTTTQSTINNLITQTHDELKPKSAVKNSFSFFSCCRSEDAYDADSSYSPQAAKAC